VINFCLEAQFSEDFIYHSVEFVIFNASSVLLRDKVIFVLNTLGNRSLADEAPVRVTWDRRFDIIQAVLIWLLLNLELLNVLFVLLLVLLPAR
jgi:hypothetical protein